MGRTRKRRSARISFGAAILAAATLAPAATAGASWSSPDPLTSAPSGAVLQPTGAPTLGFDLDGRALATWAPRSSRAWRSATRAPHARRFTDPSAGPLLGTEVVEATAPAPLVYGHGEAIAISQRLGTSTCAGLATRYALTAHRGASTGAFSRHQEVATIRSRTQPPALAFAGNRRGQALSAWVELPAHGARCAVAPVVRISGRKPGGAFGAPTTMSLPGVAQTVAVAVGERGDMLVAWRRGRWLEARLRPGVGHWSRTLRLHLGPGSIDTLQAVVGAKGWSALLWTRWDSASATRTVQAAVILARPTAISAPQVLDMSTWPASSVDGVERWRTRLVLAHGDRRALAAWTGWDGEHLRVRASELRANGRFGATTELSQANADMVLGDAAASDHGRRAVAMRSARGGATLRPHVALADAGESFAAAEPVDPTGSGFVEQEALAFSPRTELPTLVWTERRAVAASGRTLVLAATQVANDPKETP